MEPLTQLVPNVHILVGNHDTYFKDNNQLNALTEIVAQFGIKFYLGPTEVKIDKTPILLLPWICRENYTESMRMIKKTKAKIVFGHLQIIGFQQQRGSFAEEGMDRETFDKFATVLTGHFHHKSDYNNVHYLGCPFQMEWGDYGDTKGFHVFDTDTYDLTFVPNPYCLYHKLVYDDKSITLRDILDTDFSQYRKAFVRVVVKNKDNPFWYETYMDKLEAVEPLSVQTIEDMGNLLFDGEETDLIHVEDTLSLLSKYCENIGVSDKLKPKLNELLQSLYNEANNQRN
jgi:DNA repair exonuclease SbcCD nuclease subunit